MSRFRRFFSRDRRYDDLSVSIQEHLDERIEELIEEGMSREKAERTARRDFGNVTILQERSREVWQWQRLESLLVDLKHVCRRLGRSPGFAITVVLTLAIGIGANTAIFSVLNSVLIRPLPYPEPEQLVSLHLNAPGAPGLAEFRNELRLSPSMYLTFAGQNRAFQSMGVWGPGTASITGIAQPEQVNTALLSSGILETLHVPALIGQWLTAADQDSHGLGRVMLSYGYWQRRFSGDPAVVGRTISVNSQPRVIAGVMPRGFKVVNYDFDLLVPLALDPVKEQLAGFAYRGIARLRPGVAIPQANADLARLLNVWMDSWSNGPGTNSHFYLTWRITPALEPLKETVVGSIHTVLWVIMGTIGVVMLIACTNVANLLLVRADARQQELAVRSALGAGRWRIARELLLESVTLGLLGGAAGVAVAYGGLHLLSAIGPMELPRLSEISLDGRSITFTLILSVLSGLFFGAIPVLRYAPSQQRPTLLGAMRTSSGNRESQRGRNLLVMAQVAMALVLLISAVLMIRTFRAMRNVDPGFSNPASLQVMRLSIPETLVSDATTTVHLQNNILDKLAAIPGVSSAGFAASVPMSGAEPSWDQILIEGKDYSAENPPMRLYNYVSPGYFHTAGTRLVAGRDFTWAEVYNVRPIGILSESLAHELWGSPGIAIGKRFREFPGMPWHEVVGVVQDVRENGVDQVSPATVYWPSLLGDSPAPEKLGAWRRVYFAIRSDRAGTQTFINEMQQAVSSVNANLPVAAISTMQDIYSESMARTSFTLVMLAMAGAMALALGILGIYGVISYAVSQRTREIGIRIALGAKKGELVWMFVRSALTLTGVGTIIGLAAAAALMRLMQTLFFGVSPFDPITFMAVPVALIAAAALASYLPARRSAAVDPVEALRAE
ncbi:ABC transporter permease [Terriglobus saanensis]|uniref:Permease n=1 Tax=Terriglobus saanensis (strain ATCC BAA-1853 / DSM 23119 / SP1PR4) TaxID=401053 RepID=E8UXA0_TERSS|nr:ABC transporter permease [Terriglobus saanensis]ADV83063.1 permease [Terriglobus saanensis SP1PR4]